MDVVGISDITAEVELLAAIVDFFQRINITSKDVGIKVNSRKVLGAVIRKAGVPENMFAPVCVVIDKLDKIGADGVTNELGEIGVDAATAAVIIRAMECREIDKSAEVSG